MVVFLVDGRIKNKIPSFGMPRVKLNSMHIKEQVYEPVVVRVRLFLSLALTRTPFVSFTRSHISHTPMTMSAGAAAAHMRTDFISVIRFIRRGALALFLRSARSVKGKEQHHHRDINICRSKRYAVEDN